MDLGYLQHLCPELHIIMHPDEEELVVGDGVQCYSVALKDWRDSPRLVKYAWCDGKVLADELPGLLRSCQVESNNWCLRLYVRRGQQSFALFRARRFDGEEVSLLET